MEFFKIGRLQQKIGRLSEDSPLSNSASEELFIALNSVFFASCSSKRKKSSPSFLP
jgi:hypothetical protein